MYNVIIINDKSITGKVFESAYEAINYFAEQGPKNEKVIFHCNMDNIIRVWDETLNYAIFKRDEEEEWFAFVDDDDFMNIEQYVKHGAESNLYLDIVIYDIHHRDVKAEWHKKCR